MRCVSSLTTSQRSGKWLEIGLHSHWCQPHNTTARSAALRCGCQCLPPHHPKSRQATVETLDEGSGTGSQKATDPRTPLPHSTRHPPGHSTPPPPYVHLSRSPGGVPILLCFLPAGDCRLPDAPPPPLRPLLLVVHTSLPLSVHPQRTREKVSETASPPIPSSSKH